MSKTLIQLGQIWDLWFPFTDEPPNGKNRPAIIVGWSSFGPKEDEMIWFVPITSHSEGGQVRISEIPIENYSEYRLTKPSWIRPRNIFSISKNSFPRDSKPFGSISTDMLVKIYQEMADITSPKKFALI